MVRRQRAAGVGAVSRRARSCGRRGILADAPTRCSARPAPAHPRAGAGTQPDLDGARTARVAPAVRSQRRPWRRAAGTPAGDTHGRYRREHPLPRTCAHVARHRQRAHAPLRGTTLAFDLRIATRGRPGRAAGSAGQPDSAAAADAQSGRDPALAGSAGAGRRRSGRHGAAGAAGVLPQPAPDHHRCRSPAQGEATAGAGGVRATFGCDRPRPAPVAAALWPVPG